MFTESQQRTAARVAGFVLLLLMAAGFFSQIFVPAKLIVADDAAATAQNILDSERLFRIGAAADVLIFAADIVMAVAFYVLLKAVSPGLALLATLWRTAQATIMITNTIAFLSVPAVLSDPGNADRLETGQLEALANTYIGVHTTGFSVGLVMLAMGNAVFAYLLLKSRYVPKALAAWGVFANIVLATFTLAILIFPGAEDTAAIAAGRYVPVFFFEVILGGWLLTKSVRLPQTTEPVAVAR
ncbi:hypothetical protein GCM10022251_76320 [Phytohabitans flavus]|uniref:DUF4386 domain-containing protein n=2 Tax=Phytohabitans flavus TaxID=1076124 RepID=A0A6F8XT46_9ACTN|nr:DUF4386 domain-containing protein [Phytohabitans flavus]BCB76921.1 hypothetical protein Pflav_033310 [Phytohabitans flavus]